VKVVGVLGFAIAGALLSIAPPARALDIAACTKPQLLALVPTPDELKTHRLFRPPYVSYPYDTKLLDWGFQLVLRIDESGRVVCASITDRFTEKPPPLNDQRRLLIGALKDWRYTPFTSDGHAMPAIATEYISERELPAQHVPLPNVPLDKVTISLERQGCFGSCPGYKVTVDGNGRATYEGRSYVDVVGTHHYRIPSQKVAKLVESLRAYDIWSLRRTYKAGITDSATYILTIDMGDQGHRLTDYVGQMAGMPSTVSDFENEVDKIVGTEAWIHLSEAAVDVLKEEHFNFASQAGADLLARAVRNDDTHDDGAILRLVSLGAPLEGNRPASGFEGRHAALIDEALKNRRAILIDPLIAKGALNTGNKPDEHKINAAFHAAIAGGSLALVQKIWNIAGDEPHPSLEFNDASDDEKHIHKRAPVSLLLSHPQYEKGPWEGLGIAKWLIAHGCDLKASKADGVTLLHIAAEADDAEFVKYLLAQGFDPSTPARYGPALGATHNEEVAMILFRAGTKMTSNNDGYSFRRYAEGEHWGRVIDWLDSHGQ
jgi:Domain of unknown function (DUF6438)/Ankyrin repeat